MPVQLQPKLFYTPEQSAAAREFEDLCTLCMLADQGSLPRRVDGFCLALDAQGLALLAPGFATPYRLDDAMLKDRIDGQALLVRACGGSVTGLSVLDPFAGFGLDGLTLALRGAVVTLVEANAMVFALLRDFARRLGVDVTVLHDDGTTQLNAGSWDVVYLDPMFPVRRKKALPNRGLQHLRSLTCGAAPLDELELVHQAREVAVRTVLKRRPRDPVIGAVDFQVTGKSVRFDVYA